MQDIIKNHFYREIFEAKQIILTFILKLNSIPFPYLHFPSEYFKNPVEKFLKNIIKFSLLLKTKFLTKSRINKNK